MGSRVGLHEVVASGGVGSSPNYLPYASDSVGPLFHYRDGTPVRPRASLMGVGGVRGVHGASVFPSLAPHEDVIYNYPVENINNVIHSKKADGVDLLWWLRWEQEGSAWDSIRPLKDCSFNPLPIKGQYASQWSPALKHVRERHMRHIRDNAVQNNMMPH
jgi:hypothetical protein